MIIFELSVMGSKGTLVPFQSLCLFDSPSSEVGDAAALLLLRFCARFITAWHCSRVTARPPNKVAIRSSICLSVIIWLNVCAISRMVSAFVMAWRASSVVMPLILFVLRVRFLCACLNSNKNSNGWSSMFSDKTCAMRASAAFFSFMLRRCSTVLMPLCVSFSAMVLNRSPIEQ